MKKLKKLIPFVVFLLLFSALTIAIHCYRDRLFVFFEDRGFFRDEIEISTVGEAEKQACFKEWSYTQLFSDPRVSRDQSMMLVNTEYMIPEAFEPYVSEYKDTDVYMNDCMQEPYAALSAAVTEKTGKKLYVSSDFRSDADQEALYEEDPLTATVPGASEHQTGLAVDVYVAYYAGDGFIKSDAGRFVNSECWKYGFIMRYPSYGEEITGIRFEPWHIRYVGQPHAEIIYQNKLTLEEYIESLEPGVWYETEDYYICRMLLPYEGAFSFPAEFESCVFSADNTGYGIFAVEK